jgi:hypothetical protein
MCKRYNVGAENHLMTLFKGKRMRCEFADDLPPDSVCRMTEKGSMITKSFIGWLHHFGCHKEAGPCLLILMVHKATLINRSWKLEKSIKFPCSAFPQTLHMNCSL